MESGLTNGINLVVSTSRSKHFILEQTRLSRVTLSHPLLLRIISARQVEGGESKPMRPSVWR